MFMVLSPWQSHCESSPGSFDECRMAPPSGRRPKTKPDDLGCESACTGCQKLHPPLPFIIITQPESWYSFYRPTEGRRLSRPSWLVTYRDGLPVHSSATTLIEANGLPLSQTANHWQAWPSASDLIWRSVLHELHCFVLFVTCQQWPLEHHTAVGCSNRVDCWLGCMLAFEQRTQSADDGHV